MKKDVSPEPAHRPFFVVFTDLDGTLLDHDTYQWDKAKPALTLCRDQRIPVVLVSSKTRAEMDPLRKEMGLTDPFISENGGGIFFPVGGTSVPAEGSSLEGGLWKCPLGPPYEDLVEALRGIRREMGWPLRGFSDMAPEEISRRTGLDLSSSILAAMREFDEPFLWDGQEEESEGLLMEAAAQRGLRMTRGGRFHHLHGAVDKGEAMQRLIAWYRSAHPLVRTLALGDSPNDFTMLRGVDVPVLVRSGKSYPELEAQIPALRLTRSPGPRGWNEAVLEILSGH